MKRSRSDDKMSGMISGYAAADSGDLIKLTDLMVKEDINIWNAREQMAALQKFVIQGAFWLALPTERDGGNKAFKFLNNANLAKIGATITGFYECYIDQSERVENEAIGSAIYVNRSEFMENKPDLEPDVPILALHYD